MAGQSAEHFNVVDLFHDAAQAHPGKAAIIYRDQAVSFGDFEKEVIRMAAHLAHKGIGKGDRVLVFVPMSTDLYRVVLALLRLGAVAVFLDEWVRAGRLNECCRLAQCRAFIGTFKGRLLAWLLPGLRSIPLRLGVQYDAGLPVPVFPETGRADVALITFTTGSTGIPKAAIRTHGLLHEQFQALLPLIDAQQEEVCMPVLPIVLLINLGAGVTSVIAGFNPRKPDTMQPATIAAQISRHRVRTVIASPFFVKRLSRYLLDNGLVLNSIQKILTGGAPVFPSEAKSYRNAFPNASIRIVYGSTEAEPMTVIAADELIVADTGKGLKVGKTEPGAMVRIIGIRDGEITASTPGELAVLELQQGEIGEIIVSGKHVLRDYLHNPQALKRNKIFIGDQCWHRTGDSGFFDANGNLFLMGRCTSLIRTTDGLLSTFLFENHLQAIEGVEMGTVMMLDNKLAAVVELDPAADPARVRAAVSELPVVPDEVIFVPKIPRDPRHNSKIDYTKLRMQVARGK
ncbi:AMP-binding protein [Dyadobacter sp. 676]|uniref:AMP-binding protein n=1 Tax=Dyadobacter sp. 676 TaxID=3088362 RepID=A0AAU8FMM5_9BACT